MLIVDTSEVEALKSALAEAKKEVDKERTAHQKHEARLEEVQQELKDAIVIVSPWSARCRIKNLILLQCSKVQRRPGLKPEVPIRRSTRPRRSRLVRLLICKANM